MWISVKERLPEIGVAIIAIGIFRDRQTRPGIVVYKGHEGGIENWWATDGILKATATVTHWMSLPALPEMGIPDVFPGDDDEP